jgi:cell division protein FtsB
VNVWLKRAVWATVAVIVGAFAVQGGEYGTTDLYEQRMRKRALLAEVDSLQLEVDSLRTLKRLLNSDPKLQERIAREEFGMVRGDKELLYRFYEPSATIDSGARDSAAAREPSGG